MFFIYLWNEIITVESVSWSSWLVQEVYLFDESRSSFDNFVSLLYALSRKKNW